MKPRLNTGCAAITLVVIWIGLSFGHLLYRASVDQKKIYETVNAQGESKTWFVEAFMPGVDADEVLTLNYVRTGGREPPYIGVMQMTTNGLAQLRAGTEHSGTGTFADGTIHHRWSAQPEIINGLATNVDWWTLDESHIFESRDVHWKGDHASHFFIPTNGTPIYIEAVIH